MRVCSVEHKKRSNVYLPTLDYFFHVKHICHCSDQIKKVIVIHMLVVNRDNTDSTQNKITDIYFARIVFRFRKSFGSCGNPVSSVKLIAHSVHRLN